MNLKIKWLFLSSLLTIICGCLNNEVLENDKIIKKIVVYEADSIGNEFKKSIAEYDKSGYRKNFRVFNIDGEITYSVITEVNENKNDIKYFDSKNGNYETLNIKEDGKVIYCKTSYEDKTILPVETFMKYDKKNNFTSIVTKSGENEDISKFEYIYEMDLIIKKIQENISNGNKSLNITENKYIDNKLKKQIVITIVRDTEQFKAVREYDNDEKTYIETNYSLNELIERKEYKKGLLVSSIRYKENEIQTEIINKYEFDRYGNWILEKKFYKGKNDQKLGLLTETKRIIEYY